jgi:hypothetical protein
MHFAEKVASLTDDSDSEDNYKSFVISDDSEFLADKIAASEEFLGRETLEDERLALVELISRFERRLAKARSRFGKMELNLNRSVVPEI